MDNNNPVQTPITPNTIPPEPQPQTPQVNPQIQVSDAPSNGSNNLILWFVIGLVIIVLVVGGMYFFLSKQQAAPPVQAPITQVSPSPSPQENLEGDLNSVNADVAGANADFTAVDQDLQQL